jgi:23S rRNA (cytidine2498-2'-O)-methyltransferase
MRTAAGPCAFALSREGFEPEAALELSRLAGEARNGVDISPGTGSAFALAFAHSLDAPRWFRAARLDPPVFTRTLCIGLGPWTLIEERSRSRPDRMQPLLAAIDALAAMGQHAPPWRSVWVEYPDTNEGKARSKLARALETRLASTLAVQGRIDEHSPLRLHILLHDEHGALLGTSDPATTRWPLGIPRLRRAGAAPSRSVQKLAEALVVFLGDDREPALRAGQRAVDLGAAPGGWTWLLAQRGLRVTAVDNASLKGAITDDPLVTHVRADGLAFRPRRPVDWLTCDIVEKPVVIADVVAGWIADGAARRAIFNLKLPMKRRYDEVRRCASHIRLRLERAGVRASLALRQLYHDREEVTGYLARDDG